MSSYRKNVIVGATVTLAAALLVWMILRFGGAAAMPFTEARMQVQFIADRADGLGEGSIITFRGVTVGKITDVRRSEDSMQVIIDAEVDQSPPIPSNIRASIITTGLIGGGATLVLDLDAPSTQSALQTGQTISAHFAGLNILPPEFGELAMNMSKLSQQIREADLVGNINKTVDSFRVQLDKVGKVLDSTQSVLGDEKMQGDLKASASRLRDVIDKADRISANLETFSASLADISKDTKATLATARQVVGKADTSLDKLSTDIGDRLQQLSKVLERFQSISTKIDEGNGTAGLMLNDPKLYQSLVDSTRELNLTISDLRRLVEQWEQEGVSFKLK